MEKLYIDSESVTIIPEIYKRAGKYISVEFDKCFNPALAPLNTFIITKGSYSNNISSICRYANAFFKNYDEDNEFLTGLISIKYQIDSKNINYRYKQFMSDICNYLLTDSIVQKINQMVDDYYDIDLSPSDSLKNIDLHALQFMNDHGKSIMALSIAYKLTIPVVCHYYAIYSDTLMTNSNEFSSKDITLKTYLYQTLIRYFPLFQGESDLFNKFVATVNSALNSSKSTDKGSWMRLRNKKLTPTVYTDVLVSYIIVDIIPKAIFKHNIISLMHVVIKNQIKNTLIGKDKYDYSEISMVQKTDEISTLEKIEANSARISDLDIIIASLNVKDAIKKIENEFKICVSNEEIDYYKTNLTSFAFSDIILQFFAKYTGGFYDLKSISKRDYIHLMVIFKKKMSEMGFIYIHHIMTGNISNVFKKRKTSTKLIKKIESSSRFKKTMKKYCMSMEEEGNSIIRNIAMLINAPVEYVDYAKQERFGDNIISDVDLVADEYLRMISML